MYANSKSENNETREAKWDEEPILTSDKPCVVMQINDKQKIGAMIDSGSTSTSASPIANFIDEDLAHKLNLISTCTCSCKPSLTCTVTGCFQTSGCIELQCRL